jgi:predicted enzyme related to lactoylglutathione lyase
MHAHDVGGGIAWAGVTVDCRDPERVADFWGALLDAPARPAGAGREGWYRIGPVVVGGPVLNFQPVADGTVAKTPVHLDLWVDDLDGACRRVDALGGRAAGGRHVVAGRGTIAVMHDPEGHEFCLISRDGG